MQPEQLQSWPPGTAYGTSGTFYPQVQSPFQPYYYQYAHNVAPNPPPMEIPPESHRPLTEQYLRPPPEPANPPEDSWKGLRTKLKHQNVQRNVRKFISNLQKSVTKRQVPEEVQPKLDAPLFEWTDGTSDGWNPWRWDVLLVDFVGLLFNIVAVYLYTIRTVLFGVNPGVFPLIYLGVLALTIIYKLHTQILVHDKTVTSKLDIRKHYVTQKLLVDVLMVILSFFEYFHVASGVFRLVAFLKLTSIKHVLTKFEVIISASRSGLILWRLLSILLLNILVAHIIALVVIAMVDDGQTPNWMAANNLLRSQADWLTAYAWSFYWGTTVMLTIGFGDISAKNPKEAIIVAFVEMFGVITFAYCINEIQSLLVRLREYEIAKYHNFTIVNRFMRKHNTPYGLQADIKQTVGHMTDTTKMTEIEQENKIVGDLLPNLRQKLLLNVHLKALGSMSFWNRFTGASLKTIAINLERRMYYPSEIIVAAGAVPERLYMIQEGHVITSITKHSEEIIQVDEFKQKFSEGSKKYLWVLLEESVRQSPSPTDVKSHNHAIMLSVPVTTAMQILQQRDCDYQSYCYFRDNLATRNSQISQKDCSLCPNADHSKLECPFYHYVPMRSLVLNKYYLAERQSLKKTQPRGSKLRRRRNTSNGLKSVLKAEQMKQLHRRISQKSLPFVPDPEEAKPSYDLSSYLTTLPGVDAHREWGVYYQKYNLTELTKQQ